MFPIKEIRWSISILLCIMIVLCGNSITHSFSTTTSWVHVHKNNHEWIYTISIQPQDIRVFETNGMFSFCLADCSTLQIPGQPALLSANLSQKVTHNMDVFIQDIVWSPLFIDGRVIRKDQIQISSPMYATNDTMKQVSKGDLPGIVVDYIITGESTNAVCSMQVYPLQVRSGIVYFAKYLSFVLSPRIDEPFISHVEDGKKEIIICPDSWESSAIKLKNLHAEKGFSSEIIFLSEFEQVTTPVSYTNRSIGAFHDVTETNKNYLGYLENWDYSLALRIHSFLQNRMSTKPYQYLTLLGDSSLIPASIYVSMDHFDFSQSHDFYNEMIPSDFFYMSPNGGGQNLILESCIGRIPVRTVEECDQYIEKIACWHQHVDIEWFSKKALVGGDLFHQDYVGELLCEHLIEIMHPDENMIDTFFLTDNKCNDAEVSGLLQNGHYGFVNICAHGSGSEIRLEPGFIDVRDCMNFQQETALPIVFSYSCMNGAYDTRDSGITYETDPIFGYPTSFGQSLLLSPSGAIAYVGGSRVNYSNFEIQTGSQGEIQYCHPQMMDAICSHFFNSITTSETLGAMCKTTLQRFASENVKYDFSLQSFIGFTLLGDPTIQILHPKDTNPSFNDKIDVSIDSLFKVENSYRNDNVFLDSSMPLHIKFSSFSTLIIFEYNNPHKKLFEKDVSHETFVLFESLPSAKICIRLIHPSGYEKRFMIRVSKAECLVAKFPYTQIKYTFPTESVPCFYQISNIGYQIVEKAVTSISISDRSGNIVVSDVREVGHLQPLESITDSFLVTMPSKIGHYTSTLSVSFSGADGQIQKKDCSWSIHVSQHENYYRIGIPVNAELPVSITRSIPVELLNDIYSPSTGVEEKKMEFCIFPSDAINNYSFHGLILYDDDWQDFSENTSIFIIKQIAQFANNGGVVLGFSPNGYYQEVNHLLLQFFGINSNTFSLTSYSRHLEPIHIIQEESNVYQKDIYFIPSRANWEPFFPFTWSDISIKEEFVRAGVSLDKRVGLIHNAKNCFFVSCSFLSLDPYKESDDVLALIEDIMTLHAGNNLVSSITKHE